MPVKHQPFAFKTTVEAHASKAELEKVLTKGGAKRILIGGDSEARTGFVLFELNGRSYRMNLPKRSDVRREAAQVDRERWRALVLIVKGQVEMILGEVVPAEEILLPWLVLPGGDTVAEDLEPKITELYRTGNMPALLSPGITRLLGSG